MPRGRPHLTTPPARDLAVVAAYRELGALAPVGARFGLTAERVRQLLDRYERLTGDRVPRTGNALASDRAWAAHVLRACPDCGVVRRFRPSALVPDRCQACHAHRYRPSPLRRRLSDELIDRAITEILAGRATFGSIAREAGYSLDASYSFTEGVYRALFRRGDAEAIARLWPRGVSRFLRSRVG